MSISRRDFVKQIGFGMAAAGLAAHNLASAANSGGGSEKLLAANPQHPKPAPLGYDRLPLEWYKSNVARLKERVSEQGVDVILLESDHNKVYFTGCFRGSGERTTWTMFPVAETDTVYWFSPGIDRDLIGSWWCTENEYYFCYPHAEGGFPNRGEVVQGKRVDLHEWVLENLKKRATATRPSVRICSCIPA